MHGMQQPEEAFIYGHAAGADIERVPLSRVRFSLPLNRAAPASDPDFVEGTFYYQSASVEKSPVTTHRVGVNRNAAGTDGGSFGSAAAAVTVPVFDGRGFDFSLDEHGFTLVDQAASNSDPLGGGRGTIEHIDYYKQEDIVGQYYKQCCALVKRLTGAAKVVAFDHNVRGKARAIAGEADGAGQAVQGPIFGPHCDYSAESARRRLSDLAAPPMATNDTRAAPLLKAAEVKDCLDGKRRFAIMNVWRNISSGSPVKRSPLGVCEAGSVPIDDLVTFEVRYAARTGENYLSCHSPSHRWWWFPDMVKDEAMVIKNWDSAGRDFRAFGGAESTPNAAEVPATFSLHSAFEIDPGTSAGAPERESIEVRTVAIYAEEAEEDSTTRSSRL